MYTRNRTSALTNDVVFCWEKTIRLFINRIIKALITIGFPALFVFIAYGIPLCEDVNMK